jgi:hypothetical protein
VPRRELTVDEIMTMLPLTVPCLIEITREMSPHQLRQPPGAGEWSINEIVAHLRTCSDVLGSFMLRILADQLRTR